MKKYQTKQREQLMLFFAEHCDRQYTIEQLADNISGIGISSLYRNMNLLVEEGLVRRSREDGRKFLYQYIGGGDCAHHLHLQCNKCGRILHMDNKIAASIAAAVQNDSDFAIDTSQTMLFGCCASCKAERKDR